jgi:GTP-binding protein
LQWSPIKTLLPKVVIIGRPNTGKSTLFNRLLMKRRAITDPTPGVTRDPIEAEWSVNGRSLILVDTGGFTLQEDSLQELIKNKIFSLIDDAALILFVLDNDDTTQEDMEFIQKLNQYREKIILVINKIDTAEKEISFYEKHELGFKRMVGVSAEHGRNISSLIDEVDEYFNKNEINTAGQPFQEPSDIKIAILGKPNTGKSTLVNSILNEEKSIVSDIPGTTRDVLEASFYFQKRKFTILDTAGIRKKNKIENPIEYYSVNRAIKSIDESDVVVLLADAQSSFTEQDKKIAGLVERRGKGLILCLNKWDIIEKKPNLFEAMKDRIEFLFPLAKTLPVLPVSAKTHEGIEKLLSTVVKVNDELSIRVDTGELNRALSDWKNKFSLPRNKNIRTRYLTQVSVRPIRFVLFINSRRSFPGSYLQYLKNRIREDFGFHHVPIQIEVRKT